VDNALVPDVREDLRLALELLRKFRIREAVPRRCHDDDVSRSSFRSFSCVDRAETGTVQHWAYHVLGGPVNDPRPGIHDRSDLHPQHIPTSIARSLQRLPALAPLPNVAPGVARRAEPCAAIACDVGPRRASSSRCR